MTDNRIRIRTAAAEDAAALLSIYAPYVEHTAITFEYEVPSSEEFRRRIVHTLERYPYYVAERDGRAIGYAYAGPFVGRAAYDWSAELSVYIAEDCRRQGAGALLYGALESALRKMGVRNLEACIGTVDVPDEYLDRNSVEFHAHLGFRLVGEFRQCGRKFDRWYNMVWMEKIIGEHDHAAPVRPFRETADEMTRRQQVHPM